MTNFNNTLTSKIISLAIAVLFLLTDFSYAGAYSQGSLRVPIGQGGTYNRVGKVMREQTVAQPPVSTVALEPEMSADLIPSFFLGDGVVCSISEGK